MSSIEKAKKIIELVDSVDHKEIIKAIKETNCPEEFEALIAMDRYKSVVEHMRKERQVLS